MNDIIISLYEDKEINRYIKSKVKAQDIEDIKQNAIIELLKCKNENIKNYKGYYFVIVKRQIAKYYKKNEFQNQHDISTIEQEIYDNYLEIELKDYEMLYLFYIKGKSINEIKDIKNISIRQVYRLLNKEKGEFYNALFS